MIKGKIDRSDKICIECEKSFGYLDVIQTKKGYVCDRCYFPLDELTIKAKPKEISLILDIVNKIFNFKGEWNHISFHENNNEVGIGSIMIPKCYFKDASMSKRRVA